MAGGIATVMRSVDFCALSLACLVLSISPIWAGRTAANDAAEHIKGTYRRLNETCLMQTVSSTEELDEMKRQAVLIMYGSTHCSVCAAIRPRIEAMVRERFAGLQLAYVDCDASAEVCAQHSVFSLPALKLFLSGTVSLELARTFSLKEVEAGIERHYPLWQAGQAAAPES